MLYNILYDCHTKVHPWNAHGHATIPLIDSRIKYLQWVQELPIKPTRHKQLVLHHAGACSWARFLQGSNFQPWICLGIITFHICEIVLTIKTTGNIKQAIQSCNTRARAMFSWKIICSFSIVIPSSQWGVRGGERRVLIIFLGGGVPPSPKNPYPISDQNIRFSIPYFRPYSQNVCPISDCDVWQFQQLSIGFSPSASSLVHPSKNLGQFFGG